MKGDGTLPLSSGEGDQDERDRHDDGRAAEEEFEELFATCYPKVLRYGERRLPSPHAAEDVAEETFTAAWRRCLNGAPVELAWLYRVASNKVADFYRVGGRRVHLVKALARWGAGMPSDEYASRVEALSEALLCLGEREGEAVMLTYWEGLSAREVGTVLGCTTPTVWAVLSRARKKLRRAMKEADDSE